MRARMLIAAVALVAACGGDPEPLRFDNPQELIDTLADEGYNITEAGPDEDPSFITEIGGETWDFMINGLESGAHKFPNAEALDGWVEISKSFGGIAVVGTDWAVSLSSDQEDREASEALAEEVANDLRGTVE